MSQVPENFPTNPNMPQSMPNAPMPTDAGMQPVDPDAGKTLAILGIIFGILMPIIGIILGAVSMSKNKKSGGDGKLGRIAIIVSVIAMPVWVIINNVLL